jgi:Sec-independent protein translocase protein TatA
MMSMGILLLFVGLIVFGPRKTLEFAQEIGRLIGHFKQAAGQFAAGEEVRMPHPQPQMELLVAGSPSPDARSEKSLKPDSPLATD